MSRDDNMSQSSSFTCICIIYNDHVLYGLNQLKCGNSGGLELKRPVRLKYIYFLENYLKLHSKKQSCNLVLKLK